MLKRFTLLVMLVFGMVALASAQPGASGSGEMTPTTNSGIKLDQSPLVQASDKDGDGKLNMEEWTAIGGTENIFSHTDKNSDGYTTVEEMNETTPPDMADGNGDGKLTLEEFKAWRAADEATSGGDQGGGAAPGGGAPGGEMPQGAPPAQ